LLKDSTNEIGIVGLATFYLETKRIAAAESLIRNKLINDPDLSEIDIQFLVGALKVNELSAPFKQEIVGIIKSWFANNPDNDIDLKNLSDVFISSGFLRDGSELFEYLCHNKVSFAHLDLYLMLLNLQDRNDDLLRVTKDSIGAGESSVYLFYYNGIAHYKKKQYTEACESFLKGLNFLEEDRAYEEQLLTLLGESYYKLNDIDVAFEYFEKVLDLNPYNLYVLNNYSYYLTTLDVSLDKAEEMSSKCVAMDKRNFNYLDTYAWVLVKKGKYLEGYNLLKKALELGGKSDENVLKHFKEVKLIMNIRD
jgi:tetratricopeptide (TPR) repeat protein